MGFLSGRIAFILFIFLIFGVSIFASRSVAVYQFFSGYTSSSQQVEVTEEVLLERWAMAFPDIIVRLSKMSPRQQELFIEGSKSCLLSKCVARRFHLLVKMVRDVKRLTNLVKLLLWLSQKRFLVLLLLMLIFSYF